MHVDMLCELKCTIQVLLGSFVIIFLDELKECSVTATVPRKPYNSIQKGTVAKMTTSQYYIMS